ncbi:23S rRNA (guanosine(2251)-2'-O)-methyltransferase RlmB [Vallicoccus soli]|uniref:23S rRNA (Guanosine(2251)-2'-O)-methyltransferase RlmB n=1 Tax=Vallicoccus soli TaxID=2339232 RepID=A0A3A3ZMA6_9ACTN|nr:23S rRNA (guanosine(2251)-2'-O)-methyltransferase RlmB [Vallicoccus soli]RJK97755.1 23S rRNA (guanosine(2251)-2'-O)-methyltransferase RlmB [Vallicoccus soli]
MAGNSQRRGAKRNPGSKKGAVVGSGGQRRRALKGRGPTPKAEERTGHPAARKAAAVARRAASGQGGQGGQGGGQRPSGPRRTGGPRGKESSEVVAGRNSVVEALRAGVPASTLFVATGLDSDDRVREALKRANQAGVAILEGTRTDLDRITDGAVHQGVALQVPPYDYAEPQDLLRDDTAGAPLVVALDGVTDPRNLGAVVRSTSAFGGAGVVVPERRAAGMTAAAWKTSAGTAARTPVARATNLTRALQDYKERGLFVVGLDADGEVELDELEIATEPLVLVVGGEGAGLSRLVKETCDLVARIPMDRGTESLNAGVAAGVALYEVSRRRRAARG